MARSIASQTPSPTAKPAASTADALRTAALARAPANYEAALEELDRLVQQMEGGQLPLDQLLDGYRRGTQLLGYCRSRLQAVEEQVKLLDDGQLKSWSAG